MTTTDDPSLSELLLTLKHSFLARRPASTPSLGDDPLALTLLYEKWLKRDAWTLRGEAIPLLLGVRPEDWAVALEETPMRAAEQAAWNKLKDCVIQTGNPKVTRLSEADTVWQVTPVALYAFTQSQGITVPDAFAALIQFLQRVIKVPVSQELSQNEPPSRTSGNPPSIREKVLGAALNVLAKCPDQCYNDLGLVNGATLASLIQSQSVRWFDTPIPPISQGEMTELIEKWLE
jgi:hypothetical protein